MAGWTREHTDRAIADYLLRRKKKRAFMEGLILAGIKRSKHQKETDQ